MRKDPESIRAQVSAIAEELRARRRQMLELLEELEAQTSEIPEAVLEQEAPPPLEYHFRHILQAAEEELGSTVESLARLVDLDEAEMAVRWKAERQRGLFALVEATLRQLSAAHVRVGHLAVCAHNGLPDEDIAATVATLSSIRKAAQGMVAPDRGSYHLAREEAEEKEEGSHEGEES